MYLVGPNPYMYMENTCNDDNVTTLDSMSDSGIASNSSGYTSDVVDNHRQVGMNHSASHNHPHVYTDGVAAFDEDECVMNFDDEDDVETKTGRQTHLYKEYHGEDFARYFHDDADADDRAPEAPPQSRSRYPKHYNAPGPPTSIMHTTSNGSTVDYTRKKGIKQKFTQIFTLSKKNKREPSNQGRNGGIQNFSFADSKMGVILGQGSDERSHMSDSNAIDDRSNMTSDAGLRDLWSNTDTLAARSLRRRPDMRHKRSSSMGDILDDFSDRSRNQTKQDFESYRKAEMYDTRSSGGFGAKKENIWSKIGRTLKKKDKAKYARDNTTDNPIALDIHL